MKIFFLTLFIFLLASVSPTLAWQPVGRPAVCDLTATAFKELQQAKNQPIITSTLDSLTLVVWVDPNDEITVTTTFNSGGQSVTCIVAMGDKNTAFIERTNKSSY